MNFSKEELIDMVYALGESERNCFLASRIYEAKFPNRRPPQLSTFENLKRRFENTGNVSYPKKIITNPTVCNEDNQLLILLHLQDNVHISCRELEHQTGISKSSVNRIIKKHGYHPYHIALHQELHGADYDNRVNFCNLILNKINEDPAFLLKVLFSNEATFKSNALVNRHNMHYYATENPRWMREIDRQSRWSLNVWAGIINNKLIGPYFFEGILTGQMYLEFLATELPVLLEDVDLETRRNMWFQQDGAPAHFHRAVRDFLHDRFGNHWIGRGGPIAWPARSPDLTPLDFFLWGYVKQEVYKERTTTVEDMKERIRKLRLLIYY